MTRLAPTPGKKQDSFLLRGQEVNAAEAEAVAVPRASSHPILQLSFFAQQRAAWPSASSTFDPSTDSGKPAESVSGMDASPFNAFSCAFPQTSGSRVGGKRPFLAKIPEKSDGWLEITHDDTQ